MLIQQSDTNRIVFEKREYKGKDYIDVRKYFLKEETGEWIATQKGLTVTPELWVRIIEMLKTMLDDGGKSGEEDPNLPF